MPSWSSGHEGIGAHMTGSRLATPAVCETEARADAGRRGVFLWCGPLFTADPSAPVESRSHQQEGPCWCGATIVMSLSLSTFTAAVVRRARDALPSGRRVEKRARMVVRAGAAVTATQNATRRRLMPYFPHPSGSWCASLQHNSARDECERVGGRRAWRREAGRRARGRVRRTALVTSFGRPLLACASSLPSSRTCTTSSTQLSLRALLVCRWRRLLAVWCGSGAAGVVCVRVWCGCAACFSLPPSSRFCSSLCSSLCSPSSDCHRHGVVVEDGDVTRGGDECDRA